MYGISIYTGIQFSLAPLYQILISNFIVQGVYGHDSTLTVCHILLKDAYFQNKTNNNLINNRGLEGKMLVILKEVFFFLLAAALEAKFANSSVPIIASS